MRTKTLKLVFLIGLSFIALCCTNESDIIDQQLDQSIMNSESSDITFYYRFSNSTASSFLDDYYTRGYTYGNTTDISDDIYNYTTVEVWLSGSTQPDGYMTIDKTTDSLLFYTDFDRTNREITLTDFVNNEVKQLSNLEEDQNGNTLMDVDVIDYINNYDKTIGQKRFWGWSCGPANYIPNETGCIRTCCYRVMWMATVCDQFACGGLPGNNPALP